MAAPILTSATTEDRTHSKRMHTGTQNDVTAGYICDHERTATAHSTDGRTWRNSIRGKGFVQGMILSMTLPGRSLRAENPSEGCSEGLTSRTYVGENLITGATRLRENWESNASPKSPCSYELYLEPTAMLWQPLQALSIYNIPKWTL